MSPAPRDKHLTSGLDLSPSARRTRRAFLRAVGASAVTFPFIRSLQISAVKAQTGEAPTRLATFYFPHGVSSPLYRRQAADTEDEFDITFTESRSGAQCVLRCFDDAQSYGTSFKDKIVVIDGLDFVSGAVGHDGTRCVFTGSGTTGEGSSIEQYLALEAGLGAETPFSSLVLGVGTNKTGDHQDNVSYYKGVAISKMIDPTQTFNTVFASVLANGDPEQAAAAEAARARGQSVIDFLRVDIDRLDARLAPREKAKLDQHLTSLFEIEKQLAAFERVSDCQAPEAPPVFNSVLSMRDGEPNFDAITNLQLDMLAQAMACDLTRFASFWMADLSRGATNGTDITDSTYAPYNPDVHEIVAHAYRAPYEAEDGSDKGDPGIESSWAISGIQQHYAYQKVVRLLGNLQASGILDSSLVVVGNEMGDSALHTSGNVPYVLAGGAGGRLRTGRYLALKPDEERLTSIVPVNRLLVSIVQMFGAPLESFGDTIDPDHARGPLEELA